MNWINIWMSLFGTTQFLDLDIGFWVSMGIVSLLVVLMNVVFWNMRPQVRHSDSDYDENQ